MPAVNPLEGHPRYKTSRDLNSGTFGFVQLAVDMQTQQQVRRGRHLCISVCIGLFVWSRFPICLQVAIKFIERGSAVSKSVLREILNHCLCIMHPHIIQVLSCCCSPSLQLFSPYGS